MILEVNGMNRRDFAQRLLGQLLSAPAFPYAGEPKAAAPETDANCGICGKPAVFDNWLDTNLCPTCGAHETGERWQRR